MSKFSKFLKILGPGLIIGAADDDPSGIGTYSQTGAQFGYHQLWLALFCFPFMLVIQAMCGRIGIVTGAGLAKNISDNYPKGILYIAIILLFSANALNIGVDLAAMAEAGQLIFKIPFLLLLLGFALLTLLMQIFASYFIYAKYLKYLTLSLLAYIFTAFIVKQDWTQIFHSTFIPDFSFDKQYLLNLVAVLGTTISPYLFFWQPSQEKEEKLENRLNENLVTEKPHTSVKKIKNMNIDTCTGMFFSQVIMFFIIVTTAATLNKSGINDIQTAAQAAEAIRPLVGEFAFLIFSLGIIGSGLLAVPVLATSAAYAISESFSWKGGLHRTFSQAYGFYGIIIVATIIGLLINFTSIPPFKMLYYSAVFNGICAPPLLALVILISNNKKLLGKHTNSLTLNILGWIITAVMTLSVVALFVIES